MSKVKSKAYHWTNRILYEYKVLFTARHDNQGKTTLVNIRTLFSL